MRYSELVLNSIIHYFEHCKGAKQLEKICLEFIVQDQVSPGVYIFLSLKIWRVKIKRDSGDKWNKNEGKWNANPKRNPCQKGYASGKISCTSTCFRWCCWCSSCRCCGNASALLCSTTTVSIHGSHPLCNHSQGRIKLNIQRYTVCSV